MICEKCADGTDDTVSFYHVGAVPMVLCIPCYRELCVKQEQTDAALQIEIINRKLETLSSVSGIPDPLKEIAILMLERVEYERSFDQLTLRWLRDGSI